MRADITNIGAFVKTVKGVAPVAFSGTTAVSATGIDRTTYGSMVVAACSGAVTGTPDTQKLTIAVEDSADNSTFAAYKPDGVTAATLEITAANTAAELDVNLLNARKYVRVTITPAFTGGTTPTFMGTAIMLFGGAVSVPV